MEPAGRVVSKLKLGTRGLDEEALAQAAWPRAVGKKIATRTRPISLIRDRLVVEVEDQIWKNQLFTLRTQILKCLEDVLGRRVVAQLEFRVAVPRREAAVVEQHDHRADEADKIADPVLRGIYIASRRKAAR